MDVSDRARGRRDAWSCRGVGKRLFASFAQYVVRRANSAKHLQGMLPLIRRRCRFVTSVMPHVKTRDATLCSISWDGIGVSCSFRTIREEEEANHNADSLV
jgi:hypothetical protein